MSNVTLEDRLTQFGEQKIAQKTPIIELNNSLPKSDIRDDEQTSGSGSITDTKSEFKLTHSSAGDFVRLSSLSRGRYQPGTVGEAGIGIRFGSSPPTSGDYTARWGYFDMTFSSGSNTENVENGLLFGVDKDGQFIEIIRGGSQTTKVRKEDWNGENVDIDLTEGRIFQINFLYYGYGLIEFSIIHGETSDDEERKKLLHRFKPSQQTSLENTNLQVGAVAKSSSGTGSFDMFVAGRQFSVIGNYRPRTRITTESVTGVTVGTSGFTQLMSFQKKSGFREVPVDLDGFAVTTTTDLIVRVIQNPSLTSASFNNLTDVDPSETAIEVDTSATAATGGRKTLARLISGGSTGRASNAAFASGEVPVDLADEGIVTIEASAIDAEATVDAIGRMKEVW